MGTPASYKAKYSKKSELPPGAKYVKTYHKAPNTYSKYAYTDVTGKKVFKNKYTTGVYYSSDGEKYVPPKTTEFTRDGKKYVAVEGKGLYDTNGKKLSGSTLKGMGYGLEKGSLKIDKVNGKDVFKKPDGSFEYTSGKKPKSNAYTDRGDTATAQANSKGGGTSSKAETSSASTEDIMNAAANDTSGSGLNIDASSNAKETGGQTHGSFEITGAEISYVEKAKAAGLSRGEIQKLVKEGRASGTYPEIPKQNKDGDSNNPLDALTGQGDSGAGVPMPVDLDGLTSDIDLSGGNSLNLDQFEDVDLSQAGPDLLNPEEMTEAGEHYRDEYVTPNTAGSTDDRQTAGGVAQDAGEYLGVTSDDGTQDHAPTMTPTTTPKDAPYDPYNDQPAPPGQSDTPGSTQDDSPYVSDYSPTPGGEDLGDYTISTAIDETTPDDGIIATGEPVTPPPIETPPTEDPPTEDPLPDDPLRDDLSWRDFLRALHKSNGAFLGEDGQGREFASVSDDKLQAFQSQLDKRNTQLTGTRGQLNTRLNALYPEIQQNRTDTTAGYNRMIGQLSPLRKDIGQKMQDNANGMGGLARNTYNDLTGVANQFQDIASRTDPRFNAFQDAQFALLDSNNLAQTQAQSEFFARRGMGGTSAAMNAQNKLNAGNSMQRQLLAAQLGMQQLGRQDNALLNQANIYNQRGNTAGNLFGRQLAALQGRGAFESGMMGQELGAIQNRGAFNQSSLGMEGNLASSQAQMDAGIIGQQAGLDQASFGAEFDTANSQNAATESQLNALSTGLTNMTIPTALKISALAAANQGASGDSGDGGGGWGDMFAGLDSWWSNTTGT